MSKHARTWQNDWLPIIAGGLVSGGALGCCAYGGLKPQHFETIAASLAGGVGVYLASSALLSMCSKSNRIPTSYKYDPKNSLSLDNENSLCERFTKVVNELDREFDLKARKVLEPQRFDRKAFLSNVQKGTEEILKTEDMIKKLNELKDLKLEDPGLKLEDPGLKLEDPGVKPSTYRETEMYSTEDAISLKAKFREELFSYINELKGYVQGTIDPLPSARKIQFRSSEVTFETRREAVMIVREYANSMLPRLEQLIDQFVDSVCISKKILEHKVKKASEILEVSEKDLSTARLKEVDPFYNTRENETKIKYPMSCQFCQQSEKGMEFNVQSRAPTSVPYFIEKIDMKTAERSIPVKPKLLIPTSLGIPVISKENETLGNNATEKFENPKPNVSVKLTLNSEEMNYLNLLKSEL